MLVGSLFFRLQLLRSTSYLPLHPRLSFISIPLCKIAEADEISVGALVSLSFKDYQVVGLRSR